MKGKENAPHKTQNNVTYNIWTRPTSTDTDGKEY